MSGVENWYCERAPVTPGLSAQLPAEMRRTSRHSGLRPVCFSLAPDVGEDPLRGFMTFLFESLEVYQRAVDFAERITILTKNFPPQGHYHLVDQLRRASLSISLNIAEGNGRWHVKDRKNFWWIARGSVFECVPLLELCTREKLISEDTWADLKAELEILSKMLTALIKGIEQ